MTDILPIGTPTGLCDSDGTMIKVGDLIKKPVDVNKELHGEWALYQVVLQGIVPVISYRSSEKGQTLPEGYTAATLSDQYDMKMFVFAKDSTQLRPDEFIRVMKNDSGTNISCVIDGAVEPPENV